MPKQITMVKWSAKNLPYGVAFDENTGIFSGAPSNTGNFVVPVTVQTNYGTDTKDVAIEIEDLKNVWVLTPRLSITNNEDIRNLKYAFDIEQDVALLGGYLCVRYNPEAKTFSEPDSLSLPILSADIDPVTKKWVAFGSGNGVITSSGEKNFGQYFGISSAHVCWSPTLQKFCVVKSANKRGGGTVYNGSLVLDVDGNLISFVNENNIGSFAGFYSTSKTESYQGDTICWASGNINKFVNATYRTTPTVALSPDGLNWELATIDNAVQGRIYCVSWLPEQNMLIAVQYKSSTKQNYIYTSTDGTTWTNVAVLDSEDCADAYKTSKAASNNSNYAPILFTGAWSPLKKVFCLCGTASSFITRDFQNWQELPYCKLNSAVSIYGHVRWSNIANAFILATYSHGFLTLKV